MKKWKDSSVFIPINLGNATFVFILCLFFLFLLSFGWSLFDNGFKQKRNRSFTRINIRFSESRSRKIKNVECKTKWENPTILDVGKLHIYTNFFCWVNSRRKIGLKEKKKKSWKIYIIKCKLQICLQGKN